MDIRKMHQPIERKELINHEKHYSVDRQKLMKQYAERRKKLSKSTSCFHSKRFRSKYFLIGKSKFMKDVMIEEEKIKEDRTSRKYEPFRIRSKMDSYSKIVQETMKPTIITWILAIFGAITFLPLIAAQMIMLFRPKSEKAKDLIIGKGTEWRDKTHFKSALAFAWADLLLILPLLIASYLGVFQTQLLGYALWLALGMISIYFSILFWVMEKEYTYPSKGGLAYYTYFWGFFLYWGIGAACYSLFQILSI